MERVWALPLPAHLLDLEALRHAVVEVTEDEHDVVILTMTSRQTVRERDRQSERDRQTIRERQSERHAPVLCSTAWYSSTAAHHNPPVQAWHSMT